MGRVRGTYGKPWSKMTKIAVTPEFLNAVGQCMVDTMVEEAKKDFAKRGWSENDPMEGPPLSKSFSFVIVGKSTVELRSTFYGMTELVSGDIPERKMDWLTRGRPKGETPKERKKSVKGDGIPSRPGQTKPRIGIKRKKKVLGGGRSPKPESNRLPLVVPIEQKNGTVVFRMAPLTTRDAWIHPGIAKFTFAQRAARKAKARCKLLIQKLIKEQLATGDPTR